MGNTKKPTRDKGLYIMTWENPKPGDDKHYELINGFGDFIWCLCGALKIRYLTETIAQNRFIRIREQFSYWSGSTMDDGEHILTRTLDGKVIVEFRPKNKHECPVCRVMVLNFDQKICYNCEQKRLLRIRNSRSNACNNSRHEKCKGRGILWITGRPCACDCHLEEKEGNTLIKVFEDWLK